MKEPWRNRIIGHGEEDPDQLLANPGNWRIHPKAQQDALAGVLNEVGWVQTVLVNRRSGHVVDGHMRVSLALRREEPAIPVTYVDLSPEEEAEVLATFDPIGAMAVADKAKLDELLQEVQSGDAAVQALLSEMARQHGGGVGDDEAEEEEPEQLETPFEVAASVVLGDYLWPSGNEYGIPDLLPDMQAIGVDMPLNRWGTVARTRRQKGTYHFYTDDYRFAGLWDDPRKVVASGCSTVIELNYSTNELMPKALVLWGLYRKRWLARYWQSYGIRVFVDLAIDPAFQDIALLGVPAGWKAFATYIYEEEYKAHPNYLQTDYELARECAGQEPLFVVCGGGEQVKALCAGQGWLYFPGHQQAYFRNVGSHREA